MKHPPLHWLAIFVLSFGLTLASCNSAEETTEDSAADETAAIEAKAETKTTKLEIAPEDTFAADVQAVLAASFAEQVNLTVDTVACPESAELAATEPFECEVQTAEDLLVRVAVTPDAAAEKIDWQTKDLLDLVALEETIQTKFAEEASQQGTADCGSADLPYRQTEAGTSLDCSFEPESGDAISVTVTVQDDDGNVSFEVQQTVED